MSKWRDEAVVHLNYAPDGKWLFYKSKNTIYHLDIDQQRVIRTFTPPCEIVQFAVASEQDYIVTATVRGDLAAWDWRTERQIWSIPQRNAPIHLVIHARSASGIGTTSRPHAQVLLDGYDGVDCYDLFTGKLLQHWEKRRGTKYPHSMSSDGRYILRIKCGPRCNQLYCEAMIRYSGKSVWELPTPYARYFYRIHLSLDGRYGFVCPVVYDLVELREIQRLPIPEVGELTVFSGLSASGQRAVAITDHGMRVSIWQTLSATPLKTLTDEDASWTHCSISPDGTQVAVGDQFGNVQLIDIP